MDVEPVVEMLEASPYWRHLGIKVRRLEAGYCELYLPFKPELKQASGLMHGGAIASLLDAAGGMALLKMLDLEKESITTAELKVNYLNPTTADQEEVVARGRAVKKGKMLGVSLVEIVDASGTPVAVGLGTYAIIGPWSGRP
ncbi:MAG TPA: PaaI family thioesterase [Bacillota bacterium]|jgi:uncharacterized protein (TIGR00369 family)|nr:PaaI family thioesterase [Bacillota bacterium]HOB86106.1 PaaI family thioesterase [Bacillota bacterium]HOP68669.1 PaaI family thioesterase [Bacillota bacterium]HPT34208.1 PaaI family thioesterase [Bacillota bacterium]HPZ64219.1 PaaI family thioesterase [Bacillota bacterium]